MISMRELLDAQWDSDLAGLVMKLRSIENTLLPGSVDFAGSAPELTGDPETDVGTLMGRITTASKDLLEVEMGIHQLQRDRWKAQRGFTH